MLIFKAKRIGWHVHPRYQICNFDDHMRAYAKIEGKLIEIGRAQNLKASKAICEDWERDNR